MNAIRPSQDVIPLSEFRAHVKELLAQVREGRRPVVITQHGRGVAVLLSAEEYERMLDTEEMMRSVSRGQAQIAAGKGIPHEEAMKKLDATLRDIEAKHKSRKSGSKRKVPA